jgi:hypothetical protein
VAASTRCSPGGPVPRPRCTTADARRWRPERSRHPTAYPDAMPVATHTLPLSDPPAGNRDQRGTTQSTGTGSHRRPAQRADCAMGSMSPPHSLHHKEPGPTETGGGRQVSGPGLGHASRMPILRHVGPRTPWPRHSGHRRNDHAVLQRPRRIHTGVALPGRSHVRVCRPALMLCLVHISGIRCLAVLAEQCTRHGLITAVPGTTNREGIPLARCPSAGRGAQEELMANLTTEWEPTLDSRRPVGDVPHISGCSAQHSLAGARESPSVRAVWETGIPRLSPRSLPRRPGNHSGARSALTDQAPDLVFQLSGWRDLNPRPLRPERGQTLCDLGLGGLTCWFGSGIVHYRPGPSRLGRFVWPPVWPPDIRPPGQALRG